MKIVENIKNLTKYKLKLYLKNSKVYMHRLRNSQFRDKLILVSMNEKWYISLESVESICRVLNCGVDDILEFVPENNEGKRVDTENY